MELKEFLGLHTKQQFDEFWENCIFLEHYIDALGVKHHLYALHDFYVELTSEGDNPIDSFLHAFIDGPRLDKYRQSDIDFIEKVLKKKQ